MKTITVEVPDHIDFSGDQVYTLKGATLTKIGDETAMSLQVSLKPRPVRIEGREILDVVNREPHIAVRGGGPYRGRGFYLGDLHRWEIVEEENGMQTLIAWEKTQ